MIIEHRQRQRPEDADLTAAASVCVLRGICGFGQREG